MVLAHRRSVLTSAQLGFCVSIRAEDLTLECHTVGCTWLMTFRRLVQEAKDVHHVLLWLQGPLTQQKSLFSWIFLTKVWNNSWILYWKSFPITFTATTEIIFHRGKNLYKITEAHTSMLVPRMGNNRMEMESRGQVKVISCMTLGKSQMIWASIFTM